MSIAARLLEYEDLLQTPDDGNRYEIIAGKLIVSPVPVPIHQQLSGTLYDGLWDEVRRRDLGKVYFARVDVRLSKHNVVEPDLVFVSRERRHIVGPKFIDGAPDLLVEILSPSTRKRDYDAKMRLYERSGVGEYWMVDPDARAVAAFFLVNGRYEPIPEEAGVVRSIVIPGLAVEVAALFVDLW